MKTIIFFRHGKSDWGAEYDHDAARPLKKRGRKAAQLMGRFLAAAGEAPDQILTSPALRARATALLAAEAGAWASPMREIPALYETTPDVLLSAVRAEQEDTARLMLVGHEPVWSETIGRLIGRAIIRFPTAAMARVDLEVERWADADFGKGTLIWLVPPKLLED